ncbi:hypothetical protein BH23GEM9_BH23GEM9_03660 [soil metagenome]
MPGPIDFSIPAEDATTIAERVLAESIAEARAAGSYVSVQAVWLDLNDDGLADIVGELGSIYLCGGVAPCFFVIENRGGDEYLHVFSVPGVLEVTVPGTRTNGWYDLVFNETTQWRWSGATYSAE